MKNYLNFKIFENNKKQDEDLNYIYNYFDMDDYNKQLNAAYKHSYSVSEFIDIIDLFDFFDETELDEINEILDDDESYLIEYCEINNKKKFIEEYAEYLENKWIGDYEMPSNYYLEYPEKKEKDWIIYCDNTETIFNIYRNKKFKHGCDDLDEIVLTSNRYGEYYNIGYTIYDFKDIYDDEKPGCLSITGNKQDSIIMFRNSGVRLWHHGNEKYYMVFKADKNLDIILFEYGESYKEEYKWDDVWYIESPETGNRLFESISIHKLMDWCESNYDEAILKDKKNMKRKKFNL